jgi:glycosyltransferase involved in cell wall biosynthesis
MSVKRVLFVLSSFASSGPTYNALALGRQLKRKGIEPMFVALEGGSREIAFELSNLKTCIEPNLSGILRGWEGRKEITLFNPNIIHALNLNAAHAAQSIAVRNNLNLVITVNKLGENQNAFKHFNDAHIVSVSDAVMTDIVQKGGVSRNNITVIHNGVDLSRHKSGKETAHNKNPRMSPIIGTFGSLRQRKGLSVFLKAAKIVLQKQPNSEFILMGQGPELSNLRKLATELGISQRVTFTSGGAFSTSSPTSEASDQESEFLADFDVFVEPSTSEGLGLSVLQAMAWGRPVVASGAGGLYSLVKDGETGFLVQKGDENLLAEAIIKLLTNPKLATEMGKHGRERIEAEFNIKNICSKHIKLYEQILESNENREQADE